jgi:predicted nucleic acid-binding protein
VIVVDTNIIAYMTFSTPYSPVVTALYQKDPVWEAPVLWKSEFLNVLALHYRRGLINNHEGLNALDFAERLIGSREHRVSAKAVIDAVINSTCSSYDCEFIVLAKRLETKLVTYDKKIIQGFPDIALTAEAFLQQ